MSHLSTSEAPAAAAPRSLDKLKDIASGTPLFAITLFAIVGIAPKFSPEFRDLWHAGDVRIGLQIAIQAATITFGVLQMALFVVRTLPLRKAEGLAPRAVALVCANLGFAFVLLPRVSESSLLLVVSACLSIVGLVASIYCAFVLGRSFSILPQARGFVSDGPYKFVRHPLYLSEQATTFGICCQFLQPWSFLLAVAMLALQIVRMGYEEEVLAATFPAYRDYAKRTARLIPGVY